MSRNDRINRRSVLKKFGVASSASLLPSTVGASESRRDVERLSETEIEQTISNIQNEKESLKILDYISDHGWTSQFGEGTYRQIIAPEGNDFKLAAIPLSNSEVETDGVFRWTSGTDRPTSANIINTDEHEETSITVQNESVTTVTEKYVASSTRNTGDNATIRKPIGPGGGGGGGVCYRCGCDTVVSENCTNWNYDCLAIVAAAWGLSCATGGLVGCVIASGGNLALWVVGDNCNVYDNYKVSRTKVGYACEYD
ncbi:hypothetical protein [Haladaptatus cibarius]|uniref:hypothetical protein n=1 Tax=Haladaptatus cibarius TaxID=453847 RepID=UPI0011866D00|nr:hypothetical protein [Haladaptatus cibarius]